MLSLLSTIIESDRLKLIPVSEEFAQDIFKEFTDEVTTYMFPKTPQKIAETLEFVRLAREKMAKGAALNMSIFNKDSGEFLGGVGAHKLDTKTPILGIWIKKDAHGNKYGREAVTAIKNWVDQNVKYKYIVYPADKRNIPSRKIAESLGGVIEDEYKKPNQAGKILDEVEYRIYPT